jgi:photosystem II stability/assembly factor-like uncharacterized protein
MLSAVTVTTVVPTHAQEAAQYPSSLLAGLHWRDVGPMRGGRSYAVAGSAQQPDTFYFGSVGGGVWKTVNAGRTWFPIADEPANGPQTGIPIGSIGAIAVAPSAPKVIYVGTGEPDIRAQHSYGIGMYKSVDEGRTWHAIGLTHSEHIGRIVVDPKNPNLVYVAALGSAYAPSAERGVYKSIDGGAHWKRVLFDHARPDDVGAVELALDPAHPQTIYASLWATRRPPWSVYAPSYMPGSGLFKSTDGGATWKQLHGGLPDSDHVGKIGVAVAPSNPNRLWAVVDDIGAAVAPAYGAPSAAETGKPKPKMEGGIYRSDDAGASWHLVNDEQRLWGRGWYFESVTVDPKDADTFYVINTATYRTRDGGKTFVPVKGAPGGDDYHQIWVNPRDPQRMVLSSDQGTVVSVDGAESWSTWYNQPTAEIYHVAADNRFPYWLVGAQQDSGAVTVSTWSREGKLNFRNWLPACQAGESNTVVPDPKDGNILYGGGTGKCDELRNVQIGTAPLPKSDPGDPARKTWTLPEVFSPVDEALYYSDQFIYRSRDRGKSWERISDDLARVHPAVPASLDPITAKDIDEAETDRFGVVYTISPSPLRATTVWAGTDDGLLYVTDDDGRTWQNVTPPSMTAWSKVSQVEAGHFDLQTAYASVDRHRLADAKPYIYRTHDGGKNWTLITAGIPEGAYVNSVKEDPVQKGLLYAATELRVYVSFNDGASWQPLQNNMPVTSVRDLLVHGDDLAIATHGRGFWVMDQMGALREIAAKGEAIEADAAYLFKPGAGLAIPPVGFDGTPMPREEPQELNPPAGVLAYYWLRQPATGPVKLELLDSDGHVRACAASDAPVKPVDTEAINVQAYWLEPALPPSAQAGMHRFALNVDPPRGYGERAAAPVVDACHPDGKPEVAVGQRGAGRRAAPYLHAGSYTLRLTVYGKVLEQPATVLPDPRGPADAPESETEH